MPNITLPDGSQRQFDNPVSVMDIAADIGAPQPYLSKIMHRLRQAGLVVGKRGYRGGFALSRPAEDITLLQVAEAVEGDGWLPTCMLGLPECCRSGTCPTHAF